MKPRIGSGKTDFLSQGGPWVVAQFALFVLVGVSPLFMPSHLFWRGRLHWMIGSLLVFLGLGMLGAGALALGDSLTPMPYPKPHGKLRTEGVYKLVRHPIYGGLVLLIAGYCVSLPSIFELAFAVASLIFFSLKASAEESYLVARFPEYPDYMRCTRKLIPWLF